MGKKEISLFLPSYLQVLGYIDMFPFLSELGKRALIESDSHIKYNPIWAGWRGIFEYLSCVEYARSVIHSLPHGKEIGSSAIVPARFNSASLIFFAQATLDNTAVWLARTLGMSSKGGDCSFHKEKFSKELRLKSTSFALILDHKSCFIRQLNDFRMEWIHRLSGGANIYSNASTSGPEAHVQIAVPINPGINSFELENKKYLRMIENCRMKNKGEWLYSIDEFADKFANETRDFILEILECTIDLI